MINKNMIDKNMANENIVQKEVIEDACEWAIMHGVAFRQQDNTARHCPFSLAPITMKREVFEQLRTVTPLIAKLISHVAEDNEFLQSAMAEVAKASPFFNRLLSLQQQVYQGSAVRQPLLIMRTDFMDDRQHGAKVIEFNGIAAGMAPFGQRATEFHAYMQQQWPQVYSHELEDQAAKPVVNQGLEQLAYGIAAAAKQVKASFAEQGKPTFLMIVQPDEDNVYDQHLLEVELQKRGIRTVRRTFEQLSSQLSTGEDQRLLLADFGALDAVYLRAGYQYTDYFLPAENEPVCCHTLSQTRVFIEQHNVALNATIGQQLATSKTMQMLLTRMPAAGYMRWGLTLAEAQLVKHVLAEMKPIDSETITWFNTVANKQEWVLKDQGEGGGHCVFGDDISAKLSQLTDKDYDAWALMQRLYPHEREVPVTAIRDSQQSKIDNLVSEIGLLTVHFNGEAITELDGYAGYLIRSKPATENEGGIHSGQGILDSIALVE